MIDNTLLFTVERSRLIQKINEYKNTHTGDEPYLIMNLITYSVLSGKYPMQHMEHDFEPNHKFEYCNCKVLFDESIEIGCVKVR